VGDFGFEEKRRVGTASRGWQVGGFADFEILSELDGGFIASRRAITAQYSEAIAEFYADEGSARGE
jgi:hypothetical protein